MKLFIVSAALAGALASGICADCIKASDAATTPLIQLRDTAVSVVRLKIEGMTCAGCVIGARKVIKGVPGVVKADVDYDTKSATVWYDPAKVNPQAIVEALKHKLRYEATVIAPRAS